MAAAAAFTDIFFTARDGLKLHARHYHAKGTGSRRPVLCLPGLTRNARDFHEIASALAGDGPAPRDVYALDYRGRGGSAFDRDWKNYAVPIEMLDVLDFLVVTGLHKPAVIGTSRGGLITMVTGAAQPTALGPVVLNDIGPVIEQHGLARIAGYVGKTPLPHSWEDAARIVRDLDKASFPSIGDGEWDAVARARFNEKNGRPAPGYDPKLARSLSVLDGPIPALWPQFETLKHVPVMVVRGELSDLLSSATVAEMARRHPRFSSHTVPGQGHAPLLKDAPTIAAIGRFIAESDHDEQAGILAGAA